MNNKYTNNSSMKHFNPSKKYFIGWILFLIPFLFLTQNLTAQDDLSLSHSVDNATSVIGSNLIFTVTVNNEGATDITNLQITDMIPTGTVFVSATPSIGSYDENTGIWDIGSNMTSAVATATLDLEVTINHDGLIYNLAEITSMTEVDIDSTPNNTDYTEDDIASACSTVTIKLCTASAESYTLTASAAMVNYEWFRIFNNGGSLDTVSVGTNQTLIINQIGDYYYTGDISGSTCSGGSCCPITVEDGCLDLGLSLSTTSTNVKVGDGVPFLVNVDNQGTIDAQNVTVEIDVPTGFTFVAGDNPNWTLMPSGKIRSIVSSLLIGANDNLNLVLKVNASAGQLNDLIVNSEIVSSEDLNGDNLPDTDSTENNGSTTEDDDDVASVILSEFDLSLTLLTNTSIVIVGDDVTFTTNVANQGVVDAQNITVVASIPSGFDFVAADNAGWTDIGGGQVTTTIATLNSSATTSTDLILKVNNTAGNTAGDLVVVSEIMSAENTNNIVVPDADSTPDADKTNDMVVDRTGATDHVDFDNEMDDEDDMDIASVTMGSFDLALSLSTTSTNVKVGDDVPFVVTISNEGTIDAQNVVINTVIPTGFDFVPGDNPAWTLLPSGEVQTTVAVLNTGATSPVDLILKVNSTAGTPNDLDVVSEITLSEDTNGNAVVDVDSIEDNDSATEDDDDLANVILSEFDLALTLLTNSTAVSVGDDVTFTTNVANQGAVDAQNITVVAYIPSGFDFVAADNAGWTDIGGGQVTTTIATLNTTATTSADLVLKVNNTAGNTAGDMVVASEIISAENANNIIVPDADSTPDADKTNDMVVDRTGATDHVDFDNEVDDEDDMDIASVILNAGSFDLALGLSTTSANVKVGDDVPFVVTVSNEGTIDAQNVVINTVIPTGFDFVPGDNPAWTLLPSGEVQTTVAVLNTGATSPVDLILKVNSTAGTPNDLDVVSEITLSEDTNGNAVVDVDSIEDNDSATEDDDDLANVILSEFDLALTLLTNSTTVSVGDDVTFTTNVANQGAVDAQNITVVTYIPSGFDFVAADNAGWTDIGAGQVTTSIAALNATGTTSTDLVLKVNNTAGNTASDMVVAAEIMSAENANNIIVPDADSTPDSDKTNDMVVDRTGATDHVDFDNELDDEDDMDIASVSLIAGDFDLALSMTTTSTNVIAGDNVPFVINVSNEGDIDAQNVVVEVSVPSGFTFVPADNPNWTLLPSGIIQSTVSALNSGATTPVDLVLTVNVSAGTPGDLVVVSEIVASEDTNGTSLPDVDSTEDNGSALEDDDDIASVNLLEFDLALTVVADKTMAQVDENVDFTIRIANQGEIMAHDVDVVGYIPTGYDFIAEDNLGWTDIGNGKVTRSFTTLGVGGDLTTNLILKVNATAGTTAGDMVFASELMQAKNGNGLFVPDVDSTPDMDVTNDLVIDRLGATDHIDIDFVVDDEDDMDIAIVSLFTPSEFDLALTVLTSATLVNIGDDVTFNVNLANQGGVDAQNVGIVGYIPAGFDFVAADNPNWSDIGNGKVSFTQSALTSGNTSQIDLILKVNSTAGTNATDLTMAVEIMSAEDTSGGTPTDADSTPDMDSTNDLIVDRLGANDHITFDNEADDEDDMDIASVSLLGEFDLALTMLTSATNVSINDDVTFSINLANQGVVDAQNITIVAYIPTGYDFDVANNPDWTDIGGGKVTYTYANVLAAAGVTAKDLVLTVNASAGTMPGDLVTAAEIMSAEDTSGGTPIDADSTPDMDSTNDLVVDRMGANDHLTFDNEVDDEDDMDIATVTLLNCTDVDAGADQKICQGESIQLNAVGSGGSYTWSQSLGLSCTDCIDPIASPVTTTNYMVSNVDGACSSIDFVTITVVPTILTIPTVTARECCSAGSIVLNVSGGTGDGFTYQWTDNVSVTNEAMNLAAGEYQVTISDIGGTCSSIETYIVTDNCSMTGCEPLFTEVDTVLIQQGENYTTCMSFKLEDLLKYDVTMNNEVYNDPITACNVDTLLYYSYAFVRGLGNDGPYSVDWDLDGVIKTATVQNVEELKDSMNIWDSMGDWTNSTATFTISGGDYENVNYGDLNITHIGTNIPTNILVNTTTLAFGAEITVSPEPGLTQIIVMESATCCSDTLYILVEPTCGMTADVNIVNTGCCDDDGSVTITLTGGQDPISYDWGTLAVTGNELVDMASGTYSVTITDGYGCELIKEVAIIKDCDATACSDLITEDEVEVNAGDPINFCLNIKPQDYNIYNVLLDGEAYTPPTKPCNLDTVLFYTYALVVGQGATGPYEVDWTVDGELHEGMAGNMDELATLMNSWDTGGEWENNASSFIINGGSDGVNYGDMHVKHIASSVTATIMRNITAVAFGTNIETVLTEPGVHELIVQDPTTCCEDKVIITVLSGCTLDVALVATATECCPSGSISAAVTGGVSPYTYEWSDAISTTDEATGLGGGTYFVTVTDTEGCSSVASVVVDDNCDRSACPDIVSEENITAEVGETVDLCLDVELSQMDLYDIILDGSGYEPPLNPCNMDTVVYYTYALALNQGKNGPYKVDWISHGVEYTAEVQDMFELATKMNEWDTAGSWVNNDATLTISGGDTSNKYGKMDITHIETQVVANILTNFTGVGNGTRISVEMLIGGEHTLIVMNETTCCADTVIITVPLTPMSDTLFITTPFNMNADTCMDMSQLAGVLESISGCEDPINGTVEMGTDNCISYDPNEGYVGQDTFCVVICDDLSVCDTTYVVMTVEPKILCDDLLEPEFVSIASTNCEGDTPYCLDLSMGDVANYTIYDNGSLYTTGLVDCDVDTSFVYGFDEVNGLSVGDLPSINGFFIDSWMIDGVEMQGARSFYSSKQMLEVVKEMDPNGKWKIDSESFDFVGGNPSTTYGKMRIVNNGTEEFTELGVQARYSGEGMELQLAVGIHEIVVFDDEKGCSDTMTVAVSCIKPNIVMDTVYVGESNVMCLESDDLLTTVTNTVNACEEISGERVVFTLDADNCINYEGMEVGQESACLVFCDDYGLCDTTYVIVSVLEKIKKVNPVTVDDQEVTLKNTSIIIDVLVNDTIPDGLDTLYVTQNPEHGTVVVNSDNTITYSPDVDYCNDSSTDYFIYVACTEFGCDTSTVYVNVPCEKLHVFTGISPDGDATNDQFVIKGIENYPDARVCVFNRWGNLVMEETSYQNDWEGTWNGEELPSGTYFYVIYMKDGDVLSGYLQLMNR